MPQYVKEGIGFYERDGIRYPSVTTILSAYPKSPAFMNWLASQGGPEKAEAKKVKGGNRGSNVHKAIAHLLKKHSLKKKEYTQEEWRAVEQFKIWLEKVRPEIIDMDLAIFSDCHHYAGTLDLCCKIKKKIYIVDFKTSKGIWSSQHLQTAAYAKALHEQKKQKAERTAILRLGKTWEWQERSRKEQRGDFKDFLACQRLWSREHPNFSKVAL